MRDDEPVRQPCCSAWGDAHKCYSDSESFGILVLYEDENAHIGSELPPVRFCPWCGLPKNVIG